MWCEWMEQKEAEEAAFLSQIEQMDAERSAMEEDLAYGY
jgi:hypothetical protein